MVWCLFDANSISDPMLFMVYGNFKNKFRWNLNRNAAIFIKENWLNISSAKITAILSLPQCFNQSQARATLEFITWTYGVVVPCFVVVRYHQSLMDLSDQFTQPLKVVPQNPVKSRGREIGCYMDRVVPKSNRPRYLPIFRSIVKVYTRISHLRDFTGSCDRTLA